MAITAALAGLLAVMLTATSSPQPGVATPPTSSSGLFSLVATLIARPPAHHGDAATVLRQLAGTAARQPAVPFGPVAYAESRDWGLDLGRPIPYDLNYISHETATTQIWQGQDGGLLAVTTYPGGKVPPGTNPIQQIKPSPAAAARFAKNNPAKLPVDTPALRRRLIADWTIATGPSSGCASTASPSSASSSPSGKATSPQAQPTCYTTWDPDTQAIVFGSVALMGTLPLPPAVHAALLRVLANSAAQNLPDAHFYDMGTVKDRAGHVGVAIGYATPGGDVPGTGSELQVLVFDRATGALLGREWASCKGPASAYPAAGSCAPENYDQILQVKAVQTIPAPPKLPPAQPSAVADDPSPDSDPVTATRGTPPPRTGPGARRRTYLCRHPMLSTSPIAASNTVRLPLQLAERPDVAILARQSWRAPPSWRPSRSSENHNVWNWFLNICPVGDRDARRLLKGPHALLSVRAFTRAGVDPAML